MMLEHFVLGAALGCLVALAWTVRTLRASHRSLLDLATVDDLTGLATRKEFLRGAEEALDRARRDNSELAVLLIDLDGFKEVNDTLGHHAGDRLLALIGPRLRAAIGEDDVLGRIGGDEFAVLIDGVHRDAAAAGARDLLEQFSEPLVVDGVPLAVGASVGVARFPNDGTDVLTLLQHADAAMYLAKEQRTGVCVYDADLDPNSMARLTLPGELQRALQRGELVLHYQPIHWLDADDDEEPDAVEALIRWNHPRRGLVPPSEFVPVAERSTLIKPLTAFAVDAALAQCRAWLDTGREVRVSVNLSTRCLLDDSSIDGIGAALDCHGVPPHLLMLEVTESALMADVESSIAALHRLKELGVRLALDDFGTGHSSLTYLKHLPVDELKLDKSFVRDIATEASDVAIVSAVITLAAQLELGLVIEGVETEAVADKLRRLGCEQAQGFLWGPATPTPFGSDGGPPSDPAAEAAWDRDEVAAVAAAQWRRRVVSPDVVGALAVAANRLALSRSDTGRILPPDDAGDVAPVVPLAAAIRR